MNALPKLRAAILVSAFALLALSSTALPAQAAYPYSDPYFRDRAVFGNTSHFYPQTSFYGSHCRTTSLVPTYNLRANTLGRPVTLYDSFGRPYVVYQTNYRALVR